VRPSASHGQQTTTTITWFQCDYCDKREQGD
jgi:hypothetical protein